MTDDLSEQGAIFMAQLLVSLRHIASPVDSGMVVLRIMMQMRARCVEDRGWAVEEKRCLEGVDAAPRKVIEEKNMLQPTPSANVLEAVGNYLLE